MTSGKLLRKIGLASAGATMALGVASTGIAGATPTTTTVTAEFDCTSVDVSSSRHDLSNVVLLFDDGSVQRFEGLSGRTGTFAGTGAYEGLELDGVWVKAGNNKSGDGPGYGEFVDAPDGTCGSPEPAAASSSTPPPAPAPAAPSSTSDRGSHGDDAVVGAVLDCEGSVTVTSTKDLSNVVLVLSDGSEVKFDGLSGHEKTFDAPAGLTIVAVYVKSGANHSGDGPGYGEKVVPAPADDCDTTTGTDTGTVVTPVVDTVVTPVVDTPVVDTPAALAVEAAVLGTSVAGERAAAPAVGGAQVLGVTFERSRGAAPAALALTGLDLSSLLLASGGLMTSGAVLVRKARRRS